MTDIRAIPGTSLYMLNKPTISYKDVVRKDGTKVAPKDPELVALAKTLGLKRPEDIQHVKTDEFLSATQYLKTAKRLALDGNTIGSAAVFQVARRFASDASKLMKPAIRYEMPSGTGMIIDRDGDALFDLKTDNGLNLATLEAKGVDVSRLDGLSIKTVEALIKYAYELSDYYIIGIPYSSSGRVILGDSIAFNYHAAISGSPKGITGDELSTYKDIIGDITKKHAERLIKTHGVKPNIFEWDWLSKNFNLSEDSPQFALK